MQLNLPLLLFRKFQFPPVSPLPKSTADFTNSNYPLLFSKPNGYLGSTVDLTGKVSNFPEVGLLQMYVGGEIYSSYNVSLAIKVKNKYLQNLV